VVLDAFGRRFLERHADHPLLRRLAAEGTITPLLSQFPSTTTAHITTLHTGRPVGEHGLYEWRVYEPAIDEVILPLPFALPEQEPDSLRATGLDPRALLEGDTFYERLAARGIEPVAIQPSSFCPSTFDGVAAAGARLVPFGTLDDAVRRLREELSRPGRRYAYLYWDEIDRVGHLEGPDSPAFDQAIGHALDVLDAALRDLPGAVALITADHGQVAVSPERLDLLDDLWPALPDLLSHAPAGSGRDVFLHTRHAPEVVTGLAERLDGRAEVRLVADMVEEAWFGSAGPRLRARLADVCVLPAPGRHAWLRRWPSIAMQFRGQHGGWHPDERETWIGEIAL